MNTYAIEVGGGQALGVRPEVVAIYGGGGNAYMGSLRIGNIAYFQGFVDLTDGMRFYGVHDFDLASAQFNPHLRLVFMFREGARASVHTLAGFRGSLEPQVGVALEMPTYTIAGVPMERIRVGLFGGGAMLIDSTGVPYIRGGASVTAGVDLIW